MAQSFKLCPICDTRAPNQASFCPTCGTSLADVASVTVTANGRTTATDYDFRYGETDLLEANLDRVGRRYLLGTITLAAALVFVCAVVALGPLLGELLARPQVPGEAPPVMISTSTSPPAQMVTVTVGPPTDTQTPTPAPTETPGPTETPAPCMQRVLQGDSLTAIAIRCGHRSLDVLPLIVQINGLPNDSSIQVGQMIEVPWPTPTIDPNAEPTEIPEGESSTGTTSLAFNDPNFDPFAPTATATLLPGVQWHTVAPGENIIVIAVQYNADVKVLSELNPEVDFARCEFGERFGGPECIVQLAAGQILRVPEPTPVPTLSPTPSGSETPTPTATATFNAPSAISPGDLRFFSASELVTLRWVGTAALMPGQAYRVDVEDLTAGRSYNASTTELYFILPREWQGRDGQRHEYTWTVSVIDTATPETLFYTTLPRSFVWQGLTESD